MSDCCPVQVSMGSADEALNARLRARTRERLGFAPRERRRRLPKALLLAAALVLLMGTAAFAVSDYYMELRSVEKAEEPLLGRWYMLSEDGQVLTDTKAVFPEAGMVLSFSGPQGEESRVPEFRCFYLPSAATDGITDEQGWTGYLSDSRDGIRYKIQCANVEPGVTRLVLSGQVTTQASLRWGSWQVTELSADYSAIPYWGYERANYILLFDSENGWLVTVAGQLPLEELEHIARELEIRAGGETYAPSGYQELMSPIDLALG